MIITKEYKQLITEHYYSDVDALHLQSFPPHIDITFLYNQIKGHRKAVEKIPSWAQNDNIIYPDYISLEQCSSEFTATRKAKFFQGMSVLDMTGGMGVDSYFISRLANSVDFIEKNKELAKISQSNFKTLGAENIQVYSSDSVTYLLNYSDRYDCIYIDPARRRNTDSDKLSRVFALEDFRPNVLEIKDLLLKKADCICIKLAPMLDITSIQKAIPEVTSIVAIAFKNEVKEVLAFIGSINLQAKKIAINILNTELQEEYFLDSDSDSIDISYSKPETYIYEPNKAILKLDLQDQLGKKYELHKVGEFTQLFTSTKYKETYPGRIFKVEKTLPAKAKSFKKTYPFDQANVISRNHPLKANQILTRFSLKSGGDKYIIAGSTNTTKFILQVTRLK